MSDGVWALIGFAVGFVVCALLTLGLPFLFELLHNIPSNKEETR